MHSDRTGTRRGARARRHLQALLLGVLLLPAAAAAQPDVQIRYVRFGPSTEYYRLHLYVTCSGGTYYGLAHDDVRIWQDGEEITPANYVIESQPTVDIDTCFDVALVFDNSSFVTGPVLDTLIQSGSLFVDSLPRDCQRAAIVTYAGSPSIRDFLTSDRASSKTALAGMSAGGGCTMYDAVRAAVTELQTNGQAGARWILLAGAGRDNASQSTIEQAIKDAVTYDNRIFTVAVGPDADTTALKRLAAETGGLYFPVSDASGLPAVYDTLAHRMRRLFDEYVVLYRSPRLYPAKKTVRVLVTACGDSVAVTRTFQLLDSSATGVRKSAAVPAQASLDAVAPMPVRDAFRAQVTLARAAWVRVTLVDLLGRTAAVLHDGNLDAGTHIVAANARALPAGFYFCILQAGGTVASRGIVVQPR